LHFALGTLEETTKKQSRLAPFPPLIHLAVYSTSQSSGTKPLGAVRRELAALETKGLHSGIKACMLKIACRRWSKTSVTNARAGSGHFLALKYNDEYVGMRKVP
jgi:hypothetical protein